MGRKALMLPLGLLTAAALLPRDWPLQLVDCSVRPITEVEWAWAEVVMVSVMLAQRNHALAIIREPRARGKRVVAGGPYPTALPHELQAAGADYLVLDEAELTLPVFLGIETPDQASLRRALKFQNTRVPAEQAVDALQRVGVRVMAGFILGFDGEAQGAGWRIVDKARSARSGRALENKPQSLEENGSEDLAGRQGSVPQQRGPEGRRMQMPTVLLLSHKKNAILRWVSQQRTPCSIDTRCGRARWRSWC